MLEASNGNWDVGEIYAGSRHLATYSYSTTNFLHPDWLGTKRAMSSVSGAVSQTCTNLPFGDGAQCAGSTEWGYMHFTDDYHDSEDNLEHTLFRQYSSGQGRWMRPDPYSGSMDFSNPQSLNRYSYVTNNPTNAMDPLGLDGDGNRGGPFGAAACTLLSGNGDEAFGCAGMNSITRSGGGFSLGILGPGFGGGFGGIPIPGCLLPGECSISLPNASLADLFPQLPEPQCDFGPCGGNSFASGQSGSLEDFCQNEQRKSFQHLVLAAEGSMEVTKAGPGIDWAGSFTIGQIIKGAFFGGVTAKSVAIAAALGSVSKTLWYGTKATTLNMYHASVGSFHELVQDAAGCSTLSVLPE